MSEEEQAVAPVPRATRERKQVERLVPEDKSAPKSFDEKYTPGDGVPLGEIEYFSSHFDKMGSDEDVMLQMHSLFFGGAGKVATRKRQIRKFSGFSDDIKKENVITKVESSKKWTQPTVKAALGLFGLEKGGSKEECVERMVDYMMSPSVVKEAKEVKKTKSKKRKASVSSDKGSKKAKRTDKGEKVKRAPTSFILFSQAKRAGAKEANPEATFAEMGKILGDMWKSISASEKAKWDAASKAAKDALGAQPSKVVTTKSKKASTKKAKKDEKPIDFGSGDEEDKGEEEEEEGGEEEEEEGDEAGDEAGEEEGEEGEKEREGEEEEQEQEGPGEEDMEEEKE